jgi:DNA segregation ATPase FtsK/SpoIIIE-like protein
MEDKDKEYTYREIQELLGLSHQVDLFFTEAAKLVVLSGAGTVSLIERKMDISWERASYIMEQLESAGIVGPIMENSSREVFVKSSEELDWLIKKCLKDYVWIPTEEKYK